MKEMEPAPRLKKEARQTWWQEDKFVTWCTVIGAAVLFVIPDLWRGHWVEALVDAIVVGMWVSSYRGQYVDGYIAGHVKGYYRGFFASDDEFE